MDRPDPERSRPGLEVSFMKKMTALSGSLPCSLQRALLCPLLCFLLCALALTGCGSGREYDVKIVIPAGSTSAFAFSDEEVSPLSDHITVLQAERLGDTAIQLEAVDGETFISPPSYFTPGLPTRIAAERGTWYRIGVDVQNPSGEDRVVTVRVRDVEIRTP